MGEQDDKAEIPDGRPEETVTPDDPDRTMPHKAADGDGAALPEAPPEDGPDETVPHDGAGEDGGDSTALHDAFAGEDLDDLDDETALVRDVGDDTTRYTRDATTVLPPAAPAWAGRAGVPEPPDRLRDSAPYAVGEPAASRTWWTPVLLGLLALGLVGVVVLVAWLMGRDKTPAVDLPATTGPAVVTSAPVVPSVSPSAEPSATPQLVQVPSDLVGMDREDATRVLDQLGLSYSLEFENSPKAAGTVIATTPEPGALVPARSTVRLKISLGPQEPASPTPKATTTPTP